MDNSFAPVKTTARPAEVPAKLRFVGSPVGPYQSRAQVVPVITSAEVDRLFAAMPGDEATRLLSFADALAVFAASRDKAAAARAMAARLLPLGYKGLSLKSLYRKLDDFRREGVWSLVPAKYKHEAAAGIAANAPFLAHWQALVLSNRRKMRPAWKQLVRAFCGGAAVPGFGTWRELYLKERGFLAAQGEPCPWSERNPPPGWSLRNLLKFAPDPFALAAARRGMATAKNAFGFTVAKTRAGLSCCRVVEVDDMWYEHMVVYPGNREPQRVVEFAAIDVLTGHVVCHLPKPIRERADGTRETLLSAWAKYVYHYVLCVSGIPPEGCLLRGERGTAKTDAEFDAALLAANAWRKGAGLGKIVFEAGALANQPLAKGLHDGAAKGNPRHKPHIEQVHATLKNALGHVLGEVGGGRGVQPEETAAMVKEASKLVLAAEAAGLSPDAVRTPFLSWGDFAAALDEAHRDLDLREVHDLEGWEECGFLAGELKMKAEAGWRSVKRLAEMAPAEAGALAALVKAGIAEYRERRLSPREAWEKSRGVLRPLPDYLAPKILGSALCNTAKVRDNMQLVFKDPNIGSRVTVAAVAGDKLLVRGRAYRVWVNPLDGGRAYVCDLEGQYLGTAKVLEAVRADATPEELAAQLGLRQKVLGEEMRRLAPIAAKRRKEAAERAAANLAAFGIPDPAEPPAEEPEAEPMGEAESAALEEAFCALPAGAEDDCPY